MKLIKTSGRLPNKEGRYFIKTKDNRNQSLEFDSTNQKLIDLWVKNVQSWVEEDVAFTKKQQDSINNFLYHFRFYFEGNDYLPQIHETIFPINRFEISNLEYEFDRDTLLVSITLQRPGILIGKVGRTIDGLNEYLKKFDIHVSGIKECRMWNPKCL